MDPLNGRTVFWSDLDPSPRPRANMLKAGDIVRKVVVVSAPAESIDLKAMELTAAVSGDAKRDSYGDIVRVQGWDFERWLKNPVVMWSHFYWELPVAQGLWIKASGDELLSRMRFWSGDGEWAEFTRELFSMYAAVPPFMRAFSVGFMPTKWEPMYERDSDGREHFVGYDYLEKELWEYSSVPIPAYPDALAKSAGGEKVLTFSRSLASHRPTPEEAARPEDVAALSIASASLRMQTARTRLARAHRSLRSC
jgi:hypothetical protein